MNFIDDYTMMYWVYLLEYKSQAFEIFKNFQLWIENEAQHHINTLCIDNGGEHPSNNIEIYLLQNGIKNQTNFPYNHK